MSGFPAELMYVVAFAAVLLVQFLMKRFGSLEQQEVAAHDTPPDPVYAEEKKASTTEPSVPDGDFGRSEASIVSDALARPRFAKTSLLGTKREMQNAIVIATILGPCRAYEPHDARK